MIADLYLTNYDVDKIPPAIMMDLYEFCLEAEKEGLPPSVNMSTEDWRKKPETLFYKLFNREYEKLFCAYVGEQLIGLSACYKLNKNVMICGCRCWTVPE